MIHNAELALCLIKLAGCLKMLLQPFTGQGICSVPWWSSMCCLRLLGVMPHFMLEKYIKFVYKNEYTNIFYQVFRHISL